MSRSFQNELQRLFKDLKPEQRFVNILFDEVKLIRTTRFSAGQIISHANNAPSEQATSALCTEVIFHQGGPRLIFAIHPVKNINSVELRKILLEVMEVMKKSGARPISFICDNCPLNQGVYHLL